MRFFLRLLGLGLLLLLVVLVVNMLRLPSHQLSGVPAAPAVALPDSALARLAGAVRSPTVSTTDYARTDTAQFGRFGRYLRQAFPKVYAQLKL